MQGVRFSTTKRFLEDITEVWHRTNYVKRMKSFHNGMQASIRVASSSSLSSSPGFGVRNGLGQGCTLVLFNLYYNAVVSNWRSQCPQAEVEPCCVLQVVHMAVVNPALLHTLALVVECSDARETSTRHRRFCHSSIHNTNYFSH